jgi:hypothetical protein
MVAVMYHKHALTVPGMSRADQLEVLEGLEKISGFGVLSWPAIEAIEPCDRATAKLIGEAIDSPVRDPGAHARRVAHGFNFSRDVDETVGMYALTVEPGWSALLAVNPSLQRAIDLMRVPREEAA